MYIGERVYICIYIYACVFIDTHSVLLYNSGHGLVGMMVMGWWLDLMILEVVSNL